MNNKKSKKIFTIISFVLCTVFLIQSITVFGYSQSNYLINENELEYIKEPLIVDKFNLEIKDFIYKNNNINMQLEISNNTQENKEAIIILAIQDIQSKKLITTFLRNENLKSGEINKLSLEEKYSDLPQRYTVKVLLFESIFNMKPLSKAVSINIDGEKPVENKGIELKDIQSANVYKLSANGEVKLCEYINPSEIEDFQDYVVEIKMRDMPVTYSGIKNCTLEGESALIELDNSNLTYFDSYGNNVPYYLKYQAYQSEGISELIEKISANPNGTFELDKDYDVSNITEGNAIFDVIFTGTLNGNGHKISNLKIPLFNQLSNANINSLVIKDAYIEQQNVDITGTVAIQSDNSNINDVHVSGLYMYSQGTYNTEKRKAGGIIGVMNSGTIKNSSVTGFLIRGTANNASGAGFFGGIVGNMSGNIENCYASGTFNYIGRGNAATTRVGGIIGSFLSGTADRCISNVQYLGTSVQDAGGLVGWAKNNSVCKITNSFAMGNAEKGFKFIGAYNRPNLHQACNNCFEFEDSVGKSNVLTEKKTVIETVYEKDEDGNLVPVEKEVEKDFPIYGGPVSVATLENKIDVNFYTETLGLSNDVWNFENVSFNGIPELKGSFVSDEVKFDNENFYIPNISILRKLPEYNKNNEQAYSNIYKLMPYFSSNLILSYGNSIRSDDILNKKQIISILPLDKDGKYQISITSSNYENIKSILIVFEDDTSKIYTVNSPVIDNDIAVYSLDDFEFMYAHDKYVVNYNDQISNYLKEKIKSVKYDGTITQEGEELPENDLLSLVEGRDIEDQLYKKLADDRNKESNSTDKWSSKRDLNYLDEKYQELIQNAEDFTYNLLSSEINMYTPLNNKAAIAKIKANIDLNINKYLYSYIYIKRWYGIDINSSFNIADIMYFNSSLYGRKTTVNELQKAIIEATREQRRGDQTVNMYNNRLKSLYKSDSVVDLVKRHIKIFGNTENYNEWFKQYFKGYLAERIMKFEDDRRTRNIWENIEGNKAAFLPLLSYQNDADKGRDMFLICWPTTYQIGSISSYFSNYADESKREQMQKLVDDYADQWANMYFTTATFVDDAFNRMLNIRQEARDSSYSVSAGNKRVPSCDPKAPPALQNFYAVMGYSSYKNDAIAWGGGNLLVAENGKGMGEGAMGVMTHENLHCQDVRYFMGGVPKRVGAEGITNGVLAQFHNNSHVLSTSLNLIKEYPIDSEYIGNLSFERLKGKTEDGKEKVQDFYAKYFEALYTLDILEAKALLSLDKEIQRKTLYKHNYGPAQGEGKGFEKRDSVWTQIQTQEEYDSLNIKSYEDIMNNHMNIMRDVIRDKVVIGAPSYNFPSFESGFLWEPYNEYGRVDQFTAKRMPFQLLAEAGWQNGFVAYMSSSYNNKDNDLGILRNAMKYSDLMKEPEAVAAGVTPETMTYEKWKELRYKVIERKMNQNDSPYFDKDSVMNAYRAAFIADANYMGFDKFNDAMTGKPAKERTETKPFSTAIRMNMLRYLLRATDDFKTGIYEKDNNIIGISSAQQLVDEISKNPYGNFVLKNDIDFSGIEGNETSYITGRFYGRLNGNDGTGKLYKIKNTVLPLFNTVFYGHVENLIFDNVNIDGKQTRVGAAAKISDKAYFSNIHIVNSKIKGNSIVGGIVGHDTNSNDSVSSKDQYPYRSSVFSEISVNAEIAGGNTGGILGVGDGSLIGNSYTTGTLNGSGGIIGTNKASAISNCYSAMNMTNKNSSAMSGGINIGILLERCTMMFNNGYPMTVKSISFVTGNNKNKFSAGDKELYTNCFEGNYEYINASGNSNSNSSEGISVASENDIKNKNFYTDTLLFSNDIWNFDGVEQGNLPTLKKNTFN